MTFLVFIFLVICICIGLYVKKLRENSSNASVICLFLDTETTGLPKRVKSTEESSAENQETIWPEVVQLSYALYKTRPTSHEKLAEEDDIIKVQTPISTAAIKVHGITEEKAAREGKDPAEIYRKLVSYIKKADCIVIHNVPFDKNVIEANLRRYGFSKEADKFISKRFIDTMILGAPICKIPNTKVGGFKWPKLGELYNFLMYKDCYSSNSDLEGLHNSRNDVSCMVKCFYKLFELGYLYLDENAYIRINFFPEMNELEE